MIPYALAEEMDPFGFPFQQRFGPSTTFQPLSSVRRRMRGRDMVLDVDMCEKKDGMCMVRCDVPGCDPKGENFVPLLLPFPFHLFLIISPSHMSY